MDRRACSPSLLAIAGYAVLLTVIVGLTIAPYGWNVSVLLHIDAPMAQEHPVAFGTVVLDVPGYDGMEYFAVAQSLPKMVDASAWPSLRAVSQPGAYAYQRILLPLLVSAASFGQTTWMPTVFFLINIAALLATVGLMLGMKKSPLAAIALGCCPAAMVALHFDLAEPLTLFLVTMALLRRQNRGRVDATTVLCLTLAVLSREINAVFVLGWMLHSLICKRWKEVGLLLLPLAIFTLLQTWIWAIFGIIPFFTSTAKSGLPLAGIISVILQDSSTKTISSLALLVLFVLPAIVVVAKDLMRSRSFPLMESLLLMHLLLMLALPDMIWGAITSIGRVITPVYPLAVLYAADRPSRQMNGILIAILLIGLATALGLARTTHPFTIA
jgi:hypothetical protein